MKKIFLFSLLLCCAFVARAADLTENFSSLANAKYGTNSEQTISLSSGEWKATKMELKTSSNVKQFLFSSGSSSALITPALDDPGKITVDWGTGGSNKLIISYSINGGSWQQLVESASGGSGTKSYSGKTGLDGETNVRFKIVGSSSNTYVTKISIKSANVVPDTDDPSYVTEGVWEPTKDFPGAVKTIYIAPDGNDETGDGTREKPWFNLQKAINAAEPGTHIVCRGGTYKQKVQGDGKFTVRINKSGTATQPIIIRCEDGEKPVFDFVDGLTAARVGERGILLLGNYWWIFGLHITHAADNGIKLEGSYNRIERCTFSYNLDTGLQLGFGHDFKASVEASYGVSVSSNDGTWCAYNDVIDCDSYFNCDYDANYGSDADGFACKMHPGKGNRFIRCRAWHNSDDSWDVFETDYTVVLAECWAWKAGIADDHKWVKDYVIKSGSASFSGNGNGIKLGGNGTGGSSKGVHYVYNCISFGHNHGSSVKGFDCNSHKDGHVLVGCLGFDNSYDFMFESGGSDAKTFYYNNVCLGKQEIMVGTDDYNALNAPMQKNGWSNHLVTGASADDYISLDEDDALMPRAIDGSLPRKFGRLIADPENPLIDAGNASLDDVDGVWTQLVTDFPFLQRTTTGSARDLGPYERPSDITAISNVNANDNLNVNVPVKVLKNGRFVIEKNGKAYNAQGQIIF